MCLNSQIMLDLSEPFFLVRLSDPILRYKSTEIECVKSVSAS